MSRGVNRAAILYIYILQRRTGARYPSGPANPMNPANKETAP